MNPLVTIIIPCYNVERYVAKAINSILRQTYTHLEIIIVDDCSTDSTLHIVKQFTDSRIRLIEMQHNTRKIDAVNKAIELATGDFIGFQDADDWSETNRIEVQLDVFSKNPDVGICFTNFDIQTEKGVFIKEKGKFRNSDILIRQEFNHFFYDPNAAFYRPTQCTTMLVKGSILKSEKGYHPYFKGRVAEDVHLVYRMLKHTKAAATEHLLYHFLRSSQSLTALQHAGANAKAAYAWPLLAKIIEFDRNGIDLLDERNQELLHKTELEACETALVSEIKDKIALQLAYESSNTYKLGKMILTPFQKIKRKLR